MYRTGDLARYLHNGEIAFRARRPPGEDPGFRVEPDEVASVLSRHTGIRSCTVIGREPRRATRASWLTHPGTAPL
jgi:acyl-coenzyme A synthetase/AMP-(fatty) acid ligase